jgi:uncharacterized protein (DUF2267 family)
MVVLTPASPVMEAARALEKNNIGAVLVQDQKRLVGLVTDRDLAVRVLGQGLDARTPVSKVMTSPVVTLSPSDSQSEAVRVMQERNIRRIPLVENGRVMGIVTLDDLLLDEGAPLEQLAAVIQGQIGEGGLAESLRWPGAQRRAARAQSTYGRFVNQLRDDAGLESSERAETAMEVVLESLMSRLTPHEARDLIAQLPSLLQPALRALPAGPDKQITRRSIEVELGQRLDMEEGAAAQLLRAVGATLAGSISAGQMEDVRSQLPDELREVFTPLPSAPD